jgi:hypothetical protein
MKNRLMSLRDKILYVNVLLLKQLMAVKTQIIEMMNLQYYRNHLSKNMVCCLSRTQVSNNLQR